MHFVYIDESGNTSVNDRYQRFFVLAALVARGADCLALEERFNILKAKHFPGLVPEQIEIKGRNLIYGHEFFDKVKPEIRGALLAELHKILGGHSLSLFATILDKGHDSLQRLNLVPDDVYRYAYKNLIRRVDEFCARRIQKGCS